MILGFVVGGLVVGLLAGATESRLLQNGTGDILIVAGAANQNNGQFYNPSIFQAKVGQPVTWANRDIAAHTVTSDSVFDSSFLLDSFNIDVGARYQFTFTHTGQLHLPLHLPHMDDRQGHRDKLTVGQRS